jgi:hypothetical protein
MRIPDGAVVVFHLGYFDEDLFIEDYKYTHNVGWFENVSEACYYMDSIRERCYNFRVAFVGNSVGRLNYAEQEEKVVYVLFSVQNAFTGETVMEIAIDLVSAKRIGSFNEIINKENY